MVIDHRNRKTRVEVGEVWGVGRRLRERLVADGIATALDLKLASPSFLRPTVSVAHERKVHELNGIACYGFEAETQKQIICSRSFVLPVLLQEGVDRRARLRCHRGRAPAQHEVEGGPGRRVHPDLALPEAGQAVSAAVVVPLVVAVADTRRLLEAALVEPAKLYKPGSGTPRRG
ncbi:hypothetical protein [Paraburkholderia tropica]|uniref:hypothetical protein n=1 Tax=Paraburkholderia tropica TaxID=92647 RepID=UPI0031DCB446